MNEDSMPTPCAGCGQIVDYRDLKADPLEEYDMVCMRCRAHRLGVAGTLNEAREAELCAGCDWPNVCRDFSCAINQGVIKPPAH